MLKVVEVVLYMLKVMNGVRCAMGYVPQAVLYSFVCCSVYWMPWRVSSVVGSARGDALCAVLYTGGCDGLCLLDVFEVPEVPEMPEVL